MVTLTSRFRSLGSGSKLIFFYRDFWVRRLASEVRWWILNEAAWGITKLSNLCWLAKRCKVGFVLGRTRSIEVKRDLLRFLPVLRRIAPLMGRPAFKQSWATLFVHLPRKSLPSSAFNENVLGVKFKLTGLFAKRSLLQKICLGNQYRSVISCRTASDWASFVY